MSRKRCRRKVWSTPAIPITFGLQRAGLNQCALLGRSALASILDGSGTEDHVAQLLQVSLYCVLLCDRLRDDDSVDGELLTAASHMACDGHGAVLAIQVRLQFNGGIECSSAEREALVRMFDLHDQLDRVATRRQARDVALAIWSETMKQIRKQEA